MLHREIRGCVLDNTRRRSLSFVFRSVPRNLELSADRADECFAKHFCLYFYGDFVRIFAITFLFGSTLIVPGTMTGASAQINKPKTWKSSAQRGVVRF